MRYEAANRTGANTMKKTLITALATATLCAALMPQPIQTPTPAPDRALHVELERRTELLNHVFGGDLKHYNEFSVPVKVTAYNATTSQCDATPHVTASGHTTNTGIVALSRDLLTDYGVNMHDTIILYVDGKRYGMFQVEDKMHRRKRNQVDILMANKKAAQNFGVHEGILTWVHSI